MEEIWGIDLGGTKVELVCFDATNSKNVLFRQRLPTEAAKGYDHILQQIKSLVNSAKSATRLNPTIIGIGIPGILDNSTQSVRGCNILAMNGRPLKTDLEILLDTSILIANDANCFALAETKFGVVKQLNIKPEVAFGVILGTGVGGGLVIHDQLITGHHQIGGEWGHSFLDASGGKCYCGNVGCVESVISGTALEQYYKTVTGNHVNLATIYKSYLEKNDDLAAVITIERLIHFFGKAIANVVNLLDPDVIIIGGGVGNIDILYTEGVAEVGKYIFNDKFTTPIVKPFLGDSAGVFGAAALTISA
jgi:predicted NBD/HSP70 family sugar kinase